MLKALGVLLWGLLVVTFARADIPFSQATVTQVVGDVKIIDSATLENHLCTKNTVFKAPDIMQTGRRSRAQLTADDNTVTRVGSNTVFSFDQSTRTIDLKQGTILFNSPKGKGGGTIRTAAATASVIGTTIGVSATSNGGFKLVVMEGTAKVTFPNGSEQVLRAGQMTFVLPEKSSGSTGNADSYGDEPTSDDSSGEPTTGTDGGGGGTLDSDTGSGTLEGTGTVTSDAPAGEPGPILDFDLEASVEGSSLVNDFEQPLQSFESITESVETQQSEIEQGTLEETGIQVVDADSGGELTVVVTDTNTFYSPAVERLRTAATQDVTITDGTLPAAQTFYSAFIVPPEVITELDPTFNLGDYNQAEDMFLGMIGRDITLSSSTFDFSAFGSTTTPIMMLASNKMTVSSTALFTGLNNVKGLEIGGVNALDIPDFTNLTATFTGSAGEFELWSARGNIVSNDNGFYVNNGRFFISADMGNLSILSVYADIDQDFHAEAGGTLYVDGGNILSSKASFGGGIFNSSHDGFVPTNTTISNVFFEGQTGIEALAQNNLTISSLTFSAGPITIPDYFDGKAKLGKLTASNIPAATSYRFHAGTEADISYIGGGGISGAQDQRIEVKANSLAKLTDVSTSALNRSIVDVTAHTVLLSSLNLALGSQINAYSQYGTPDFGTFTPGTGKVYIDNVVIGGTTIHAGNVNTGLGSGGGLFTHSRP